MQQPSVKVGIVIIMTVAANISFKWGLPYILQAGTARSLD
jgi:hypothetical protein